MKQRNTCVFERKREEMTLTLSIVEMNSSAAEVM